MQWCIKSRINTLTRTHTHRYIAMHLTEKHTRDKTHMWTHTHTRIVTAHVAHSDPQQHTQKKGKCVNTHANIYTLAHMDAQQINAVSVQWVKFKVLCVCVCTCSKWSVVKATVLWGVLLPPTALISLWTLPSSSLSAKHNTVTLLWEILEERQRESETKKERERKREGGRGGEGEGERKEGNYLVRFQRHCLMLPSMCVCVCTELRGNVWAVVKIQVIVLNVQCVGI